MECAQKDGKELHGKSLVDSDFNKMHVEKGQKGRMIKVTVKHSLFTNVFTVIDKVICQVNVDLEMSSVTNAKR